MFTRMSEGRDKGPIRILLVEDFPAVRESVRDLLSRRADMEVVGEAGDGLEAVELARSLHPDIVVMDITLPRLHGIMATERICAESPKVRVIAYSIHDEWLYAQNMMDVGARGYVTKSDVYEDLVNAIHAVMSGQRFLSSGIQKPEGAHPVDKFS